MSNEVVPYVSRGIIPLCRRCELQPVTTMYWAWDEGLCKGCFIEAVHIRVRLGDEIRWIHA